MKKFVLLCLSLLFVLLGFIWAGTTGKIAGKVRDKDTGEPVIAANVEVINPATGKSITGAATGLDGSYFILNIPPGIYDVRVSAVGYATVVTKNVTVSADKTTTLDFELKSEALKGEEVVVTAQREKIQKDVTTSTQYTTGEDISSMPVKDVSEVLGVQAGVVSRGGELHFRGGRAREVAYVVDGMPVQDPTYGYQALEVATNSVQEIQVQTGAFNAEYGGALSAIVNIVTKEGDPNKMAGSLSYRTDNFRIKALNKYTTNSDRLEFSLSGPEPLTTYLMPVLGVRMPLDKRISYFVSITGENADTRLPLNRRFNLDYKEGSSPMATQDEIYGPYKVKYGWYGFFPERRVNQYQATLKIKQNLSPSFKYMLSYTGNWNRWRSFDWSQYYCPWFSDQNKQDAYQVNLTVSHTLSPSTFYEARAGYFYTVRELTPAGWAPGDFAVDSSGVYRTLDDWVDINGDGAAQVRLEWWDANGNGMWDYGEYWRPTIERIDTIWNNPATRDRILEIDTLYSDTLPPQIGEEPWVDWNNNGVFEPRMTNFLSPLYGYYSLNLGEPYMDGEPFLDGYPYGLNYSTLMNGTAGFRFVMETLWVDVNGNGRKDWGEYVYGSYYETPDTNFLEERTWFDANRNGTPDWGEWREINGDGEFTVRDGWCNYTDANQNGYYDLGELGEPFLDLNGNGRYDPPNGIRDAWEPYIDRNGNGKFDDFSGFQYRGFDRWAVWHKRKTQIFLVKGDLTSQVHKNHLVKTGIEYQWIKMNMNMIQYPEFKYDREYDGGPWPEHGVFRSFYTRTPSTFALYVQDKMEYGGLVANVGLRADLVFQAPEVLEDSVRAMLRDIVGSWWKGESDVMEYRWKISPRLGMSYPITDRSKLFFSYGHFYQLPGFDNFYETPTQASSAGRLVGNPNLSYEKTVAYELGVAYAFADNWTAQLSGYYKDIYDLLNTVHERVGPIDQDVYVNHDYARTRGVEVRVDKALSDYWSLTANYSYSFAFGKSSSDRSGYDARFDQTAIPLRDLPLDWDQRHLFNMVLDVRVKKDEHPMVFGLRLPDNWGINLVTTWGSGFPYTPSKYNPYYTPKPGEKSWERTNALRMPNQFNMDLKFNKDFKIGRYTWTIYLVVENLTDHRNVLSVYSHTGKPDKSWVLYFDTNGDGVDDSYKFMGDDYDKNPSHWGPPRNISVGFEFGF